jgi:hypothetical protein
VSASRHARRSVRPIRRGACRAGFPALGILLLIAPGTAQTFPAFDHAHIVERTDSFRVLTQGLQVGALTRSLVSSLRGGTPILTYAARISFGELGHQNTTVIVDRQTLRALQVDQVGQEGGNPLEVHVTYDRGKARGTYRVPAADGVTVSGTVDTLLGAEVLDDNLLQAFAPALPLPSDTGVSLHVYDAALATLIPMHVTIADGGSVTTPAGTFSTWRLDITGGEAPFTYFVSRTTPRRLVRIDVPSQELTIELVR